jgi:hypothetical protein
MKRLIPSKTIFSMFLILLAAAAVRAQEVPTTQQLAAAPGEEKKLGCLNVSRRWQVCGSTNFKNKVVVGVGIRFSKIDPNGRVLVSRTYENCSKLAGDKTIPANIRAKAAAPCEDRYKLAVKEAAVVQ